MKLQFGIDDAELIERESCYQGFFSLERFTFRHRRFDGSWSRNVQREVFVRSGATCVLPYDPVLNKVCLLEQFRAPVLIDEEGCSPWLIELVAGINDKGETPEQIAIREAQEEAGLTLRALKKIVEYYPSPGGASERVYLFCALADLSGGAGIFGLPEEDEDIRTHVLDVDEAMALIDQGLLNNAPAIMALQWLQLKKSQLDSEWLNVRGDHQ